MKDYKTKWFLKNYRWRVDPCFGVVFTPRKKIKNKIGLGPSIAKLVNKEIADMPDDEFLTFLNNFNSKSQNRLQKLRETLIKMREKGETGRF